jgi:hypothetical protein
MNHNILSLTRTTLGLGALLALTACASSSPVLDASFGNAVREARAAQTLNPKASAQNTQPALGIDGKAANEAQKRYVDSFKAPPKTFEVINIGGTITGE